MVLQPVTCRLYEPDGTLLTTGTCLVPTSGSVGEGEVVAGAFDQPGRVVQRCILDRVREVQLQLASGAPVPAHVERLFYDPHLGRTCTLRVTGT